MNVQNIAEVITTVVVAIIGIAVPYVAKFLKANKTASTIVSILPTLAKDAVITLQKLGATTYIEGDLKKSKAATLVETTLKNLGFTNTDSAIIESAVESAYADLVKDGTLSVYTQADPTTTTTTTSTTKIPETTTTTTAVPTTVLSEDQVHTIVNQVLTEVKTKGTDTTEDTTSEAK